ncbi:MAG: cysteine synthase A [Hyphomicrobiaceae bacterium]
MGGGAEFRTLAGTAAWGRGRVFNDITETIGQTPLVRLAKLAEQANAKAEILLKLEFFNPLSSVKDRIGVSMIDALEADDRIKPNETVLVEPTSGNTGIALAFVAASRGYDLILTMPESMSLERRRLLTHMGARLDLTPAEKGMKGAIDRARELIELIPNAVQPSQFENMANPAVHEMTTAEEIWSDTAGEVDTIVAGIGTGGTLTGCGTVLRPRRPSLRIVGVEPTESAVLSGGQAGPHKIQGIGAGFVPAVLNTDLIDEMIRVPSDMAFEVARLVAKVEGVPAGISTGANVAAALTIAVRDEMAGKRIVTFAPSSAERYLSSELFVSETVAQTEDDTA